jgi:hypothetical protein
LSILVCVSRLSILVCCEVFPRSLFVFLSFFFWPLYCLSFDLRKSQNTDKNGQSQNTDKNGQSQNTDNIEIFRRCHISSQNT